MTNLYIPFEFRALASGYHAEPVTLGMSGASVYRLTQTHAPTLFLKICGDRPDMNGRQEFERFTWLAGKLPVPRVLGFVEENQTSYMLLSAVPGIDASDDIYRHDMPQLVRLLAEGLRMIHAVPMGTCPFDHSTEAMLVQARWRVEQGLVDESDFDSERQGRRAVDLFDQLVAQRPPSDDLVFTHGDYCLPNIIIDNGAISGFIDIGRAGIGDRYRDLALAARSLVYNDYAEGVKLLFEIYGIAPDAEKLAFFQLMDEFF